MVHRGPLPVLNILMHDPARPKRLPLVKEAPAYTSPISTRASHPGPVLTAPMLRRRAHEPHRRMPRAGPEHGVLVPVELEHLRGGYAAADEPRVQPERRDERDGGALERVDALDRRPVEVVVAACAGCAVRSL